MSCHCDIVVPVEAAQCSDLETVSKSFSCWKVFKLTNMCPFPNRVQEIAEVLVGTVVFRIHRNAYEVL